MLLRRRMVLRKVAKVLQWHVQAGGQTAVYLVLHLKLLKIDAILTYIVVKTNLLLLIDGSAALRLEYLECWILPWRSWLHCESLALC